MLNFYQLEQQLEARMKTAHVPGLALALVKDQQVVYAKGFGVTSVEDGSLPITPQTLFRIGSVTKPLTGTAIMRLVEAGKLDLDRPVKEYVPWLTFSEESAVDHMTLRMLLSHTAGLPTAYEPYGRRDPDALEALICQDMPHYQFIAPPGKLWFYSNPGINLASYIAEVVSGQSYTEIMQTYVFGPLDMKRTTFDPTVGMTYPLAQAHDLNEDGTLRVLHRSVDNAAYYPAGFAMSTVLDLANFALMQMNQGRFRDTPILSPDSVAQMQTVQADLFTATNAGYGLTFGIETYKGMRVVGHDGNISTYSSKISMIPEAGVAIVMLLNRASAHFEIEKIVNSIFDQLLDLPEETPQPQEVTPKKSLWSRFIGSYLGPYSGLATIQVVDNHLMLDLNGKPIPLKAMRKDLYFGQKPESDTTVSVGFLLEEAGSTQYIIVDGSPCRRIERDTAFIPNPAAWQAYTGTYAGIKISIKDDHLYMYSPYIGKEMHCIPLDNTHFACDWSYFQFNFDDDGTVSSLELADTWTFPRSPEAS